MHVCGCACLHVCVCMRMYVRVCVCVCVHAYIRACVCTCACVLEGGKEGGMAQASIQCTCALCTVQEMCS